MPRKKRKKQWILMFALITMALDMPAESVARLSVRGPGCFIGEREALISQAGEYLADGAFDGRLVVDAPNSHVRVILNGTEIASPEGPAIFVKNALTVTLAVSGDNVLEDGGENNEQDGQKADAAIFSVAPLTIEGEGRLRVTGRREEGIASESTLTINGGELWISAKDDGLNAQKGITINYGYLYIDAGGDGIDSNADLTINGGTVIALGGMSGGDGGLDADEEGFKLLINGGFVIAAGYCNATPDPASGQKYMQLEFAANKSPETTVRIEDKKGDGVTFTPSKEYREILFSSGALREGETYAVYLGGAVSGETRGVRQTLFCSDDKDLILSGAGGTFIVGMED